MMEGVDLWYGHSKERLHAENEKFAQDLHYEMCNPSFQFNLSTII